MRGLFCIVVLLAGCGRLGYERRADTDAPELDAAPPMIDARVPVCPVGMTELTAGSSTCIELVERGDAPWTTAKLECFSLGRRLCADAEWFLACTDAAGIVDMIDGGFEWVAEEAGGVALKRGKLACTEMSSHAIADPYEYRCCAPKV